MARIKNTVSPVAQPARRTAGRPREFDEGKALAAARSVFLDKGLAASTLDDLTAAMKINRPSLYAAFTDKEALYLRTLDGYVQDMQVMAGAALGDAPTLRLALKRFYGGAIEVYTSGGAHAVGCYIVCSAIPEAVCNERVRAKAAGVLRFIDSALEQRFRQAIDDGELPAKADPAALAALAGGILHSLAVRARGGAKRKELDALAANAIQMLTKRG
jgi:AcrR family transcriptional regulator